MSEPNDRPPGERRTDAGSRVIVERLDLLARQQAEQAEALADQLDGIRREARAGLRKVRVRVSRVEARVRSRPTRKTVGAMIAGAVAGVMALVFSITWSVSNNVADRTEKRLDRLEAKVDDTKTTQQVEIRALKKSVPRAAPSPILDTPVQVDGGTPEDAT